MQNEPNFRNTTSGEEIYLPSHTTVIHPVDGVRYLGPDRKHLVDEKGLPLVFIPKRREGDFRINLHRNPEQSRHHFAKVVADKAKDATREEVTPEHKAKRTKQEMFIKEN